MTDAPETPEVSGTSPPAEVSASPTAPKPAEERDSALKLRLAPPAAKRMPRVLAGTALSILLGGAAVLILLAEPVRDLLGFGTSQVEPVQREASTPSSISTEVPFEAPAQPERPLETALPAPAENAADASRLAALEAELAALRTKEAGLSRADLQAMLDANAAQMRSEMNRMLMAQRPVTAGVDPGAASEAEAEARKRMEAEKARRAAIDEAQVKSRGLVLDGGSADGPMIAEDGGSGRRRSGNESFLASASSEGHETVRASALADPARMIVQGTLLEGVLETAVSTDLPGAIRAVLSQDVLSYDGSNVLLPRGSRLIGAYSAEVKIAQRRALVAWNRAITPDGTSVALGGFGADALGRSGQTGQVDTHFWERFGSAALISILGLAPQIIIDDRTNGDAADAIEDVGDDLRAATSGALDAYLRIPPTINVSQGDRITIFVNRDLLF